MFGSEFSLSDATSTWSSKQTAQVASGSIGPSADFISSVFTKSSEVAAKLSEDSSWSNKKGPDVSVDQNQKVAEQAPEEGPIADENLDQQPNVLPESIQMPLFDGMDLKIINSVIPFGAGPEAMGVLFKSSMETRYKDLIKTVMAATLNNTQTVMATDAATQAAAGGWWVK